MPLLEVEGLTCTLGGVRALDSVSLALQEGERRGLVGPNGAGKSTFVRAVSGEIRANSGSLRWRGEDITGLSDSQRARLGITRTFQRSEVFDRLTVGECLDLAENRPGRARGMAARSAGVAEQFDLVDHLETRTRELSHGERRRLEIAMAVLAGADLFLLDEPMAGLGPREREVISSVIESLPQEAAVVMIEHDLEVVRTLMPTVTCLAYGQVLAEGPPSAVMADPSVIELFVGSGSHGNATGE